MAGRKENGAEFSMPIKAVPYHHQMEAFRFACGLFGILPEGGDGDGSGGMRLLREEDQAETKPDQA